MKKTMIKKALLSLSIAFAVSAAVGVNALTANAEEAINPAFASLALQNGASIRYAQEGEEATQEGFSYVLEMDAQAYAEVAANEAFTNVQYGILIGPEAYYDAYPFNTQANIDAYYSLNEEAEGKAFLYDMQAVEFTAGADESKVYYRGSIVELKENNLIRDYRGVGYVAYTFEGQDYKFFFTDETNVRCPVEIADLTIDTLNTEADADTIAALQANYINKIDWTIETHTDSDRRWYQKWSLFEAAGPAYHNKSWETKYGNNRYINSKYTTTYAYERAGEEPVAFATWAMGTSEQRQVIMDLEGVWTLTGRTTCEFLPDEVVTYTKKVSFEKFFEAPSVNGNNIATACVGSFNWDDVSERYYNPNDYWNNMKIGYYKIATGAFIVDMSVSRTYGNLNIVTANDQDINVRLVNESGVNGLFIRVNDYWAESKIMGPASTYTHNGTMNVRVAYMNQVMFFFVKSYTNESGAIVDSADWRLVATLDKYVGFVGYNGMEYVAQNGNINNVISQYNNFLNAATNNQFGFSFSTSAGAQFYFNIDTFIDDDTLVYNTLKANESVEAVEGENFTLINGGLVPNEGTSFTQDENGYWNTNAGMKAIGKASGDYMVALKLKSTSEFDFRVYSAAGKYFSIVSATHADYFFMDSNNGWWSETRIGYNTAKFVNDNFAATKADGYLDVMLVRYQGVYYIYGCEYLDENGAVATFDNWQLLVQFNADKTTPAGEGIVIKNANGDPVSNVNGNLSNATVAASTVDNAFVLRHRTGNQSGKIVVTDDDAAVAAFMASEKAVAEYAKA